MPPKTPGEMSAFERRRLENIAANNAILKDISKTAAKILPQKPKAPTPKRSSAPRARREQPKRETARPVRMSSRLAGIDAEQIKVKRELDLDTGRADRPAKKTRVSGDLNLGEILVEGRKFAGAEALASLKINRGAEPGVRTFFKEDADGDENSSLKDMREQMSSLQIYDKWEVNDIKIVPQRIYSMGFHPTEEKQIIFAGDKEGAMGVFDASQEKAVADDDDEDADVPDPVIAAFKTHARTISTFHFSPTDANAVYSGSYDSSIRKLDLEKGKSVEIWAPSDPKDDMPISAIDMAATDGNIIYFSDLNGSFGKHDMRMKPDDADIWRLTDHKIGGFSLHPAQPHLFATASLDRTLKIWDLRRIAGKGDLRHPSLVGEHESRLSVSHASWSAGGQIATSSYDDTIKIYDFADAGSWAVGHDVSDKKMKPTHTIRHNNQTGRWVTILKPQWQLRPKDGIHKFAIGNMNRFVDIFSADGSQLAQLEGDGITAVPAVAHFHPTQNWVVGGTASGKVCLWM